MKPYKPAIRRLAAAFITLLLLISFAIAVAPLVVDGHLLRKQLVSRIEQFTGGTIEIRGRVQMTSFISFAIEAEDIRASGLDAFGPGQGFTASRMEARIDWLDLLRGEHRFDKLIFEGLTHTVAVAGERPPAEETLGKILTALEGAPFNEVILRDARFASAHPDGSETAIPLRLLNLRLKRRDASDFVLRGKAVWKDETLIIQARKSTPVAGEKGLLHPIRVSITGKPATLMLEGDLSVAPRLAVSGDMEFSSSNFGAVPSWLGFGWATQGLISRLALAGVVTWTPDALTLEQGEVAVNGSRAEGMLLIKSMDSCPVMEGKLAFRFLDLGAFRAVPQPDGDGAAGLLSCLSADLRVSADELAAATVRAGPAAAAISVRNGKLSANIAELQIFDGVVHGAVEVDLAASPPAFIVRTTARDISLNRVTSLAGTGVLVEGRGVVNVDMQGRGSTPDAVLASLKGHSRIYISEGGALGPKLLGMMAILEPIANSEPDLGLFLLPNFKTFKAEIRADNGVISAKSLEISRAGWLLSGRAQIVAARQHIEGRLDIRRALDSASVVKSPLTPRDRQTLTFEGYWHHPTVTLNGRLLMEGQDSGSGGFAN